MPQILPVFCSKNEIELVESGDETIPSIVVLG